MSRPFTALAGVLLLALGAALFLSGALPRAEIRAPSVSPATATPAASVAAASPTPLATATAVPTIGPIADGYRIQIPRLGIDLPLVEGDVHRDTVVQATPDNFAFHLPGTGIPGLGSNSYIYAHARRGMFLSLWNARIGDEVVISTPAGTALKYVVAEIHPRVSPQDTTWVQPTEKERLTLQTSTGPNPGDPRFVVVAFPA